MFERQRSIDAEEPKGRPELSRISVLVVTPYTPRNLHGHAADDLGRQLVRSLSDNFVLHVYAPNQSKSIVDDQWAGQVSYHHGSSPRPSFWRHFGIYPAALRKDWSKRNTREVLSLIRQLQPDRVHVEYLQPVEAVLRLSAMPWTVTLHDVTSRVFQQRAVRSRGLQQPYRWIEYLRTEMLEKRVVRKANRIFTLSARDAEWVKCQALHQKVSHLRIGMDIPPLSWSSQMCDTSTFVFAGAMWRDSNVAAALFVAHEVMPLVWRVLPSAVLRIVGSRPTPTVVELGQDPRIEVVGQVQSIEEEYIRATAVLSPSLVDAGVLLKALRALACGSPTILNETAAVPLEVSDGTECYVRDSPEAMANQMIAISDNPESAEAVAAAGRAYVRQKFSWVQFGKDIVTGLEK